MEGSRSVNGVIRSVCAQASMQRIRKRVGFGFETDTLPLFLASLEGFEPRPSA
jgi:hypothetical protein